MAWQGNGRTAAAREYGRMMAASVEVAGEAPSESGWCIHTYTHTRTRAHGGHTLPTSSCTLPISFYQVQYIRAGRGTFRLHTAASGAMVMVVTGRERYGNGRPATPGRGRGGMVVRAREAGGGAGEAVLCFGFCCFGSYDAGGARGCRGGCRAREFGGRKGGADLRTHLVN